MKTTTTNTEDLIAARAKLVRDVVQEATAQLDRSERGRNAAKALRKFLDEGGYSLDSDNQRAVKRLIEVFFAGSPRAVMDHLEEIR